MKKSIPSPGELGSMHPLYTFLFLLSEHEDCFKGVNPNKRGLPDFKMGGLRNNGHCLKHGAFLIGDLEPTTSLLDGATLHLDMRYVNTWE